MKTGYLGTIRWEPFPVDKDKPLSLKAGNNAVVRAFLSTGIPRPPQDLSVLDEARFFLRCASEIEHGLLIQYLYALYSLNVDDRDVGTWTAVLREIAREEMGHLLTVQNLLIAIGAEPYFDRQYLATDPFPFQLEPLSRSSLAKYVTTESPGAENVSDAVIRQRVEAIEAIALQAAQNPEPVPVYDTSADPLTIKHVGGIYAWLYWLFLPGDKIEGPWNDLPTEPFLQGRHLRTTEFTGLKAPRQAEAVDTDWGLAGSEDGPIFIRAIHSNKPKDKQGALQTIFDIAVQGEGFADTADSHFQRFLAMFDDLERVEARGTKVSRPLATSPSVHRHRPGRTIRHPVALLWAELFNARYQMLLLKLSYAMSQKRETGEDGNPAHRQQLIQDAVNIEMLVVLRPIADRLTHLPLKPRHVGGNGLELAGPTFELPDGPLPTQPNDVREQLLDLIAESLVLVENLCQLKPSSLGEDAVDLPTKADKDEILNPILGFDQELRDALIKAK